MNSETAKTIFDLHLKKLKTAISAKDKKGILAGYDEINLIDFNKLSNSDLEEFEKLTDKGNSILYS